MLRTARRLAAALLMISVAAPFARAAVPAPDAVIPTIQATGVSVRWTIPSAPAGWTVTGFHVYRAAAENGPWARLTTSPLSATTPAFTDPAPASLASAFYTVTTLSSNGVTTEESPYAEAGQAANNLVYNPSFEQVSGSGAALGWEMEAWSGPGWSWGDGTSEAVDGARAAYLQAGPYQVTDEYGWPLDANTAALMTTPERHPVVTPGTAVISGVCARFRGASGATAAYLLPAWLEGIPPTAIGWYPVEAASPAYVSAGQPDAPWRLLADAAGHTVRASSDMTRLSLLWDVDGMTPPGARAWFDEVRYQVRRVGTTGTVFGRVQDARGLPIAGARVSAGGRTAFVDPYLGVYVLRDLPTGPVALTVSIPGQPDQALGAANYGGVRVPDVTLAQPFPLALSGTVTVPGGLPAPGARVTVIVDSVDKSAVTDAAGRYRIEDLPATDRPARVYATKAGYTTATLNGTDGRPLGLAGVATVDLVLGAPQPVIEAARTGIPPTLDGILTPAEWSAAQPVDAWFRSPAQDPASLPDRAYVLWDDANLYVAFDFAEPNTASVITAAHGEDAWTDTNNIFNVDDTASLFLDPSRGISWGMGHEGWQLTTNYNAADPAWVDLLLRRGPEARHDKDSDIAGLAFTSRVDAAQGRLVTEVRVPFAGLAVPGGWDGHPPALGDEWGVLLGRFRKQTGESSATSRTSDWWGAPEPYSALRFVPAILPPIRGDLDGDRAVTAADAATALRVAGGLESLGDRLPVGDVVSDGRVDLRDALRILRAARGLDTF